MRCPRCNAPIEKGQPICENCGEPLAERPEYDDEIVFSNNYEIGYRQIPWRIILPIAAAVLIIIAAVIVLFVINRNQTSTTKPYVPGTYTEPTTVPYTVYTHAPTAPTTTHPTTAPPTTVPPTTVQPTTEQPTTVAPTTLPPTTAQPTTVDTRTDNEKVKEYAEKMGIISALKSTADANMTVDVTVEQSMVIASYKVNADSTDEGYKDYFTELNKYFDTVCSNLDRAVYELRTASGVSNATLNIVAFDRNEVQFYNRVVD